jgi:hypothetical protein
MFYIFTVSSAGSHIYGPYSQESCERQVQHFCDLGFKEVHFTLRGGSWEGNTSNGQAMGLNTYFVVEGEHVGVEVIARLLTPE